MLIAYITYMNSELIAIPVFQDRISPLLDEARKFILFEVSDGEITQKIAVTLDLSTCLMRIARLKELGVMTIVSGAVSGRVSDIIIECGIRHYPWNNGDVNEVMEMYINNRLQPCRASVNQCERRPGRKRQRCCSADQFNPANDNNNEER